MSMLQAVKAALDFPATDTNNPLVRILTEDQRPNKQKSVAYLYAFRKLLTMPATDPNIRSMQALLQIPFPASVLLRVLMIDAPVIAKALPAEETATNFEEISNSMYARTLTILTEGSPAFVDFLNYQLLFPLSPAMVIANYTPFLDNADISDRGSISHVGEISKYPKEIVWLMQAIINSDEYDDTPLLDSVFPEFDNVLKHLLPQDVRIARQIVVDAIRDRDLDTYGIEEEDYPNPNQSINIPSTEQARGEISNILAGADVANLGSQAARALVDRLRTVASGYENEIRNIFAAANTFPAFSSVFDEQHRRTTRIDYLSSIQTSIIGVANLIIAMYELPN